MKPALDSGFVWLGGFRWEDGRYEVNLTLVFKADKEDDARAAGKAGQQQSIWNNDPNLSEEEKRIIIDEEGGGRSMLQPGWRRDSR